MEEEQIPTSLPESTKTMKKVLAEANWAKVRDAVIAEHAEVNAWPLELVLVRHGQSVRPLIL
jgi:hypothetical protein